MTAFIFLFICVFGITVLLPYSLAKYRGRVYGMFGPTPASRRKYEQQQRIKYNMQHVVMLNERRQTTEINIWHSDFKNNNPNICEFCKILNETWFHKIKNSQKNLHLSTSELQNIKELYIQQVYTPSNFPVTWRDPKTWIDANGRSLELRDITEEEIKNFYFKRCPLPPIQFMDVISFLETAAIFFGTLFIFGIMCA
jgi:hypothetical protein